MAKMESMSDNALMFTLKVEGDSLHMSEPTGQSYTAKLDGTEAPYKGDPGITTVSVKRIDKSTIEETDKLNGKTLFVARMTVSADGKTLALANHDVLRDETSKYHGHEAVELEVKGHPSWDDPSRTLNPTQPIDRRRLLRLGIFRLCSRRRGVLVTRILQWPGNLGASVKRVRRIAEPVQVHQIDSQHKHIRLVRRRIPLGRLLHFFR